VAGNFSLATFIIRNTFKKNIARQFAFLFSKDILLNAHLTYRKLNMLSMYIQIAFRQSSACRMMRFWYQLGKIVLTVSNSICSLVYISTKVRDQGVKLFYLTARGLLYYNRRTCKSAGSLIVEMVEVAAM
jgi:hypothetical protein